MNKILTIAGLDLLTSNRQILVGDEYDADKLIESGIYRIGDQTIKNVNGETWSFLICLKFDINTTIQFLISMLNSDVKIQKRKLSPTGFSSNSEWQKL